MTAFIVESFALARTLEVIRDELESKRASQKLPGKLRVGLTRAAAAACEERYICEMSALKRSGFSRGAQLLTRTSRPLMLLLLLLLMLLI